MEATIPAALQLTLQTDSPSTFRDELGQLINAFHEETVPRTSVRFAVRLHDADKQLVGGLSGTLTWGWLFIETLWVHRNQRGQGSGKLILTRAENHAVENGCHSAWLDTFQSRAFYEAQGYGVFGTLEDYPVGQTRAFLKKALKQIGRM
jgi:GNAT superfamily N-acetyltransferase